MSNRHFLLALFIAPAIVSADAGENVRALVDSSCLGCHNDSVAQGGLNLRELEWDLADLEIRRRWALVHDRVSGGEMPPTSGLLSAADRQTLTAELARAIRSLESDETSRHGRASIRRLNRVEYENTLRDLLRLPHLEVVDLLPPDGKVQSFAKVGEALDISYVQMNSYLDAVEAALRLALVFPAERPKPEVSRYYAREQRGMVAFNGNCLWNR